MTSHAVSILKKIRTNPVAIGKYKIADMAPEAGVVVADQPVTLASRHAEYAA